MSPEAKNKLIQQFKKYRVRRCSSARWPPLCSPLTPHATTESLVRAADQSDGHGGTNVGGNGQKAEGGDCALQWTCATPSPGVLTARVQELLGLETDEEYGVSLKATKIG